MAAAFGAEEAAHEIAALLNDELAGLQIEERAVATMENEERKQIEEARSELGQLNAFIQQQKLGKWAREVALN